MNGVDVKRDNWKIVSSALVVHLAQNLIISLRFLGEDDKEMHQTDKRPCLACKTIVFFLIKYADLWRFRSHRSYRCLRSLMVLFHVVSFFILRREA